MRKRGIRAVLQVELKGVAKCVYWGGDCAKNIFSRILEFRGHKTLHKVEVVKSSKAGRNKVIDIWDETEDSCRPLDIYAKQGVIPSIGIIISIQEVVEFKKRGHLALWSAMIRLSKCEKLTT
jgi:hypothetical protein